MAYIEADINSFVVLRNDEGADSCIEIKDLRIDKLPEPLHSQWQAVMKKTVKHLSKAYGYSE